MKIFTIENLVVLCVMIALFIVIFTIMICLHHSLIKKIKNIKAKNLYLDNTNSYVVNVNDTRERILCSTKPIDIYIDPFKAYRGANENLDLRFLLIILFVLTLLSVLLSALLMLGDFFHQDIVKLLNMEYTRSFWEYFKNYDLLFGSFLLNVLCFTGIRLISNTIITYRKYEPIYLKEFNDSEIKKTYSPVYINLD